MAGLDTAAFPTLMLSHGSASHLAAHFLPTALEYCQVDLTHSKWPVQWCLCRWHVARPFLHHHVVHCVSRVRTHVCRLLPVSTQVQEQVAHCWALQQSLSTCQRIHRLSRSWLVPCDCCWTTTYSILRKGNFEALTCFWISQRNLEEVESRNVLSPHRPFFVMTDHISSAFPTPWCWWSCRYHSKWATPLFLDNKYFPSCLCSDVKHLRKFRLFETTTGAQNTWHPQWQQFVCGYQADTRQAGFLSPLWLPDKTGFSTRMHSSVFNLVKSYFLS